MTFPNHKTEAFLTVGGTASFGSPIEINKSALYIDDDTATPNTINTQIHEPNAAGTVKVSAAEVTLDSKDSAIATATKDAETIKATALKREELLLRLQ